MSSLIVLLDIESILQLAFAAFESFPSVLTLIYPFFLSVYVYLFFYLNFFCLSILIFITHPGICPLLYCSICPSIRSIFIHSATHSSVHLYMNCSVYLCFFCLSVYPPILSIFHPFSHLSGLIHPFIKLFLG